MSKRTLKIKYRSELGGINSKLDKALEKCLTQFGYHYWASGFNLITRERDLAFEVKANNGK